MTRIKLRRALSTDADMVFHWRNAFETRKYCFDPHPLIHDHHIEWFEESLKIPSRCLLIAELEFNPIGVLRYDINDSRAEVAIFLKPGLTGQGLGTKILLRGTDWMKINFPQLQTLQAKVMANNIASARAFKKAGFDISIKGNEKNIGGPDSGSTSLRYIITFNIPADESG